MQYFDAGRAAGATHIVVDPRRTATAAGLDAAPGSRCPAPTWRWPTACCTWRSSTTWSTSDYIAPTDQGLRRGPGQRRRLLARPGRADHRRPGRATCARPSRRWPRADRAMILTARGAEQHSNGTDTAQAFINLALALGLPGRPVLRLRHDHRPGQRPGRPRARPEGRPAARLPQARRPGRPRARRRRSGGSTPTSCPARDCRPSRCSTGWAPTGGVAGAAGAGLQHRRLRPRRQPGRATGCAALDLLVVSDIFLSETAELADVVLPDRPVGRGGGHDDQPRGPGDPPPAGAAAARGGARRPAGDEGAGRPAGPRAVLLRRPARRCSTSCAGPAPAGSPTTPASATSGSTPSRACSGRARSRRDGPPRHAAAVRRRLPHRRRPGRASSGSSTASRPRRPTPTTRTC